MPAKNIFPGQQVSKDKLNRARELRREMTSAEKALWQERRGNKPGVHFRRQQVIEGSTELTWGILTICLPF